MRAFTPPPWCGEELTGDRRYANQTLATMGLPDEGEKRDDVAMESASTTAEEARELMLSSLPAAPALACPLLLTAS